MAILKTQKHEMTYDSDTKQAIFGNRVKTAYMPKTDPFPARMLAGAKPTGPVPVITIDGVDYYHKCEFDLENLANGYYNLLDGSIKSSTEFPFLMAGPFGPGLFCAAIRLAFEGGDQSKNRLYIEDNQYGMTADFTSHAFNVVDTQEEVVDTLNDICLPTCSAYYGFLSEDGKTFISYFNLKEEA